MGCIEAIMRFNTRDVVHDAYTIVTIAGEDIKQVKKNQPVALVRRLAEELRYFDTAKLL